MGRGWTTGGRTTGGNIAEAPEDTCSNDALVVEVGPVHALLVVDPEVLAAVDDGRVPGRHLGIEGEADVAIGIAADVVAPLAHREELALRLPGVGNEHRHDTPRPRCGNGSAGLGLDRSECGLLAVPGTALGQAGIGRRQLRRRLPRGRLGIDHGLLARCASTWWRRWRWRRWKVRRGHHGHRRSRTRGGVFTGTVGTGVPAGVHRVAAGGAVAHPGITRAQRSATGGTVPGLVAVLDTTMRACLVHRLVSPFTA